MKTPTYLAEKEEVIIFKNDDVINNSKFEFHDEKLILNGEKTLFLYLEDYKKVSLKVNLEENAQIKLYMIIKSSKPADYGFIFNLDQSAKLDVFTTLRNIEKTEIKINREFNLKAESELIQSNALLNMGDTDLIERINLNGEKASVKIDLLNIGSYNDKYKVIQEIFHKAKYTISSINNSLISNSNSKLKYSVSGSILKGNEFSNCKQVNKGIILNEFGEIEVEPKLFIDEYNVEASHGAAIGQIDEEQLYYLLSRGLTEMEARSLIISGYTKPFLNNIDDEDIKHLVERQILKMMNEADII